MVSEATAGNVSRHVQACLIIGEANIIFKRLLSDWNQEKAQHILKIAEFGGKNAHQVFTIWRFYHALKRWSCLQHVNTNDFELNFLTAMSLSYNFKPNIAVISQTCRAIFQ